MPVDACIRVRMRTYTPPPRARTYTTPKRAHLFGGGGGVGWGVGAGRGRGWWGGRGRRGGGPAQRVRAPPVPIPSCPGAVSPQVHRSSAWGHDPEAGSPGRARKCSSAPPRRTSPASPGQMGILTGILINLPFLTNPRKDEGTKPKGEGRQRRPLLILSNCCLLK